MVFKIEPVKSGDIPSITIIQWAALQSNPLIQTLYPRGPTPSLTDFTVTSYQNAQRFPSVRLMKAVDPDTGNAVAFAKWIVFRKDEQESERAVEEDLTGETAPAPPPPPPKVNGGWHKAKRRSEPPDCYVRALEDWNGIITRTRKGMMGNRRHSCASEPTHSLSCYFACYAKHLMVLDILHTHPAHQGKGAGVELVKWGTDLADEEGLQCYVEASPQAVSTLRFCGFDDVTEMNINLGMYRAGLSEYKHTIMIRPPYGQRDVQQQPPPIPRKSQERPNLIDQDPAWVDIISEYTEEDDNDTSSEISEHNLEPPSASYTAEARMLDMRSSASTGSPRLEAVRDMRSPASMKNVRTSSSLKDVRSSGSNRSV